MNTKESDFMNKLEKIFSGTNNGKDYASAYIDQLARYLKELDCKKIEDIMSLFEMARQSGNTIFFIGNGGSAATSSHFANDFTLATRGTDAVPFRAVSLCDNNALLTALANDEGFDNIFVEQLRPLAKKGDIVVAISASGNSANLVKAIEYANGNGLVSVGFAGFTGGAMADICQQFLYIPSAEGEYGPAEDVAMVLDHLMSTFLTYKIYGDNLGFRPGHAGYSDGDDHV
jgi:D-sedoheptulose 7-phosphate isomerase